MIPFLYDNITLFRRSGRSGSETRLYYSIMSGFVPQPDLQYIMTIFQLEKVLFLFHISRNGDLQAPIKKSTFYG